MLILRPKQYINDLAPEFRNHPLIFLGGPIRGADEWHTSMCLAIKKIAPTAIVCCPARWEDRHPLARYFTNLPRADQRQRQWERHWMDRAGISWRAGGGCISFWLPLESTTNPRPREEGPYAQDTRNELGEWRVRTKRDKARVEYGGSPDFPGLSVLQFDHLDVVGYAMPYQPTIEKLARHTVMACERAASMYTQRIRPEV